MIYEYFKKNNDISKSYFPSLMKIIDVNFESGFCTVSFEGNITPNMPIQAIVNDVIYNEMGALSNPSKLKNWKGFEKK